MMDDIEKREQAIVDLGQRIAADMAEVGPPEDWPKIGQAVWQIAGVYLKAEVIRRYRAGRLSPEAVKRFALPERTDDR